MRGSRSVYLRFAAVVALFAVMIPSSTTRPVPGFLNESIGRRLVWTQIMTLWAKHGTATNTELATDPTGAIDTPREGVREFEKRRALTENLIFLLARIAVLKAERDGAPGSLLVKSAPSVSL
jgi:hypothetical protein